MATLIHFPPVEPAGFQTAGRARLAAREQADVPAGDPAGPTPAEAVEPTPAPIRDRGGREDDGRERDGDGRVAAAAPTPEGFLVLLARRTVAQARTDGAASAVRSLLRTETFLRSLRAHLLLRPCEARGDSYNVGLIMIELMIMRESLRARGVRSVG